MQSRQSHWTMSPVRDCVQRQKHENNGIGNTPYPDV